VGKLKKHDLDPVTAYAKAVESGEIPACEWVKLACRRHLILLREATKKGYRFDVEQATRVINFFFFLRHIKGEWAGTRFNLSPWQQFVLGYIMGWRRNDGTRLVRTAYVEVPRKNGKTTLAAGLALYLLLADGEPGAEIYVAATKRDQAKLTFDPAREMARRSPAIKKRVGIYTNNIHVLETASKFEPLGADKDTLDGLNIHGLIIDELHAHKDRGMWDVLTSATGARRQPLTFVITTAGLGGAPTVCRQEHDYSEQVLRGVVKDDSRFVYIATIDQGDDWIDEAAWRKANPNYGISVKPEFLRQECEKALATPAEQNKFRRYYLNEWVQQETRFLDLRAWDASAGLVRPEKLEGLVCYGGLDLANRIDLAAFVLVFPPQKGDEHWYVLPYFWVPEAALVERSRRDRVPYDAWARQGFIRTTPGEVIDYATIRRDILELSRRYRFHRIGYDPWNAFEFAQRLQGEGFEAIEVRPGYRTMTEPTKELARLVLEKKLRHGGNPVLRWMADNLVVQTDPAGNLKPDKEKSREKIDGIVALITALAIAMRYREADTSEGIGITVFW
jgi:phage terminase large subunit-like protein